MTWQWQYLAFVWRHRSVVTSKCQLRKDCPLRQWRNGQSIIAFWRICVFRDITIAWKKWNNECVCVNNDNVVTRGNHCRITWQNVVIHANPYSILYFIRWYTRCPIYYKLKISYLSLISFISTGTPFTDRDWIRFKLGSLASPVVFCQCNFSSTP